MRIIHLTDLHLFADAQQRLKDVPTRESFLDVIKIVESKFADVDYLIITGDFAHDEQQETYEFLRQILGDSVSKCRLVPGNHDNRDGIRSVFPEIVPSGSGPINFSLSANGWRMIGLDSHLPGEVAGRVENEQLDWLEGKLSEHSTTPTALFMHHPPVAVESEWLDQIGLQEPERLQKLVTQSPQVRVVCCGHIHQEFSGKLGTADVLTTPSTAIQFTPRTAEPLYEAIPPGFRLLTFEGDSYRTEVVRLAELKYPPVME